MKFYVKAYVKCKQKNLNTLTSYIFEPFYLLEEKTAIFDEIFKFMIYLMRGT